MPINALINQAHDAVVKKDFTEASRLYGLLMKDPELRRRLDIKVRFAFCLEKTGKYLESIKYYEEVISIQKENKNVAAIEALESKVTLLQSLSNQQKVRKKPKTKKKPSFTEQMDAASTRDFAGFLALDSRDLASQQIVENREVLSRDLNKLKDNHDQSLLNYTGYLALGTQDFSLPEEEEPTLKLPKEK